MTHSSLRNTMLAFAALGAFAVSVPAAAQVYEKEPSYEDEVVVTAPYVRREYRRGRVEEVSVSRTVSARDLDLRYDSDVSEFRRRIRDTAALTCDEAEAELDGVSLTSDRECERVAIRGAMAQADDLIDYHRG